MDLNDLLAEIDGIGSERAAQDISLRTLPPAADAPAVPTSDPIMVQAEAPILTTESPVVTETPAAMPHSFPSLDLILDVELEVQVELGQVRVPLKKMVSLQTGDALTLDGRADAPLKILVNDQVVAYGEPLVVDGSLAVRLVRLVPTGTEG